MEISWYGHSCFRLTEKVLGTVVTDPYDYREVGYKPLSLKADLVTVSHNSPGHSFVEAVDGTPHILTQPGEYEIAKIFVTGIQTNHSGEPLNTVFVIDINGINVVHLGNLNRVLTQAELEQIGPVHIALVPVGGSNLTPAHAAEVVSQLEPNIVIPMHYDTPGSRIELGSLSKFLKEMGITETQSQPSLKFTNAANIPEETRVIVLDLPAQQA